MKSKAAVKRIIETLKGIYPDALCSLQYEKDYELLFAVRLSAQCTDARVNQVTPALYARFPTLESFAEADPAEVGEYIRQEGYVCDTHCIRITGRLGITDGSKDPLQVEKQLRLTIPPEESNNFCHRMVLFGRDTCTARSPRCAGCALAGDCGTAKASK